MFWSACERRPWTSSAAARARCTSACSAAIERVSSAGQLGAQRGQRRLSFRQPRQLRQAALQLDEAPHAVAGQAQPLFQAGKLPGQRSQLIADGGQPRLALRDLAGDGAAADEPAAVVPRVEVAGAELAAHETLAGDRLALVAQLFESLALDVTAEQQIHVGAGGGVIGLHLGGQPIRPAAADFAVARGTARMRSPSGRPTPCKSSLKRRSR